MHLSLSNFNSLPISSNMDTKNKFVPSNSSLPHVQAILMFLLSLFCYRLNRSNAPFPSSQIVFQTSFSHQSPWDSYQLVGSFLSEQLPVQHSSWSLTSAVWDGEMILLVLQTTFCIYSPQKEVSLFRSSMMLLTHVQLVIHSNQQLPFFRTAD